MATLSLMMPGVFATWDQPSFAWTLDTSKGGTWLQKTPDPLGVFPTTCKSLIIEATIDLSGWQRLGEDITFFPEGFSLQDPGRYSFETVANQFYDIMEIISTTKFSQQQLVDAISFNTAPGLPNAAGDWDRVTFGRTRTLSALTAGGGSPTLANTLYTQDTALFGSGEPVAANVLYCYRVIQPHVPDNGAVLIAPASRFIIKGTFAEENPLVHLDRMYRSYNSR